MPASSRHFPVLHLRSTLALLLGGAIVLAGPTSTAPAALAGAKPLSTPNRPDLRYASVDGTTARWCFDKSLDASSPPSPDDFALAGYGSASLSLAPKGLRYVDAKGGGLALACVTGQIPADLRSYTIGMVADGAVSALGGRDPNRGDATALAGSDSHSGSRGFTSGPDLLGTAPDPATGQMAFVFDQGLGALATSGFHFYSADGTRHDAISAKIEGRVVLVRFGPGVDLGSAVRAFVDPGAATSTSRSGAIPSPLASSVLPGGRTDTLRPDLQSAVFSPDGNFVDFAYDPSVRLSDQEGAVDPSKFRAYLADGTALTGTSATLHEGSRVRVEFPTTELTAELLVHAAAGEGAVRAADSGAPSSAGGVAIGGSAGALAAGFTTGPDALAVTLDATSGTADVIFDQRVFTAQPQDFRLLDGAGTDIGAEATAAVIPSNVRGPTVVSVHFTPAQIQRARALEVRGYGARSSCSGSECGAAAVMTAAGGDDAGNDQQILSP